MKRKKTNRSKIFIGEKPCTEGGLNKIYDATWRGKSYVAKEPKKNSKANKKANYKEILILDKYGKQHKNLAKRGAIYKSKNEDCYCMLIEKYSKTLEKEFKENRYDYMRDTIEKLEGLSDSVSFLHSKGIMHQDIKPSNIGMKSKNEAVLFDFGSALSFPPSRPHNCPIPTTHAHQNIPTQHNQHNQHTQHTQHTHSYYKRALSFSFPFTPREGVQYPSPSSDLYSLSLFFYTRIFKTKAFFQNNNLRNLLQLEHFTKVSSVITHKLNPAAFSFIPFAALLRQLGQYMELALHSKIHQRVDSQSFHSFLAKLKNKFQLLGATLF